MIHFTTTERAVFTEKGGVWRTYRIKIQVRKRIGFIRYWTTVKEMYVMFEDFRHLFDMNDRRPPCMQAYNGQGDFMEVWPPYDFDFEQRATELYREYLVENGQRLRAKRAVEKAMQKL